MPIVLENSIKETISKACLQKTSSFIEGETGSNPFDAAESLGNTVGIITGGFEAILALPTLALKITSQVVTNVSTYAAKKLGTALAEVIMPPSPAEILGEAAKKTKDYIKSVGELIKELSADAEKTNEENAKAKQTESINQKTQKHKENISKVKAKVNKIVKEVNEKCTNINNFISAGSEWVEKQATIIEQKSIGEIDKVLDANIKKILKDKKEFIQNLSDGIARRNADQINKAQKKITKEKLDKIVRAKQKLVNKAKAKIGSALLNLMAKLGL